MPYKKTNQCPICKKPIYPFNKFCRKHAPKSEAHKKNISEALKGKPRPYASHKRPEHSEYLKKWWKEHPEERDKARERGLRMVQNKEYLEKLSFLLSGEKNPNWRNGISAKKYKGFYQKLKDKIRKRDNYICQLCNKTEKELGYTLSINHIDYDKENSSETNLISLCKRCNSLVNFGREQWTQYFKDKIAIIYGNGKSKGNIDTAQNVI